MRNFVAELRRRNVIRVVGAYLVVGWVLIQIATTLEESMRLPSWFDGVVVGLLLVGLPVVVIVAWVFDLTPEGVVRTGAQASKADSVGWRKLDYVIIAGLIVVAAILVSQWYAAPGSKTDDLTPLAASDTAADASIAVLPFADLSPNGDQAYFSDGISEEILNLLAGVPALNVTSRTSAFQFKGRELGIPEIAANLKVRHVVEGSVRKAGNTLRITAQLIDAEEDRHLWSNTYDRPLTAENIFAIQDEIAKAVVGALGDKLGFNASRDIAVRPTTDNLTAYEQFLKARSLYQTRTQLDVMEELLKSIVEQDPNFAQAWELRAANQFLLVNYDYRDTPWREQVRLTNEYANKALALEPNSSIALAALANVQIQGGTVLDGSQDFVTLLANLSRAIEIDPHNDSALNWRATLHLILGDVESALADYRSCVEYSPLTAPCAENYITVLAGSGRDQEAFRIFENLLDYGIVKASEADLPMLARMGQETAFKAIGNSENLFFGWNQLDDLYKALRDPGGDHSQLRRSLRLFEDTKPGRDPFAAAIIFGYLGEMSDDYVFYVAWSDSYSRLRQTARFKNYIRRAGILRYWQQHGFPPQCRAIGADDFECD
jgi:TolB-like protein